MAITTLSTFANSTQTIDLGDDLLITSTGGIVSTGIAVQTSANDVNFANLGLVYTTQNAFLSTGLGARITNSGTIESTTGSPVINMTNNSGLSELVLVNHGQILGSGDDADCVLASAGGNFIYNHGTMFTHDDNAIQIFSSFEPGQHSNYIFNSGVIQSNREAAIVTSDDADTIRNIGVIDGSDDAAIQTNFGADKVINSGMLLGGVALGQGNDLFIGLGGQVDGTIDGGTNDDQFWIDQADAVIDGGEGVDTLYAFSDVTAVSNIEDILLRGAGAFQVVDDDTATTIVANASDNLIFANGGDDTVSGRGGNDELLGGAGEDFLNGNIGNDFLSGGADGDILSGGAGNDLLDGGNGDDVIVGNEGNDTIIGGQGRDLMRGQQGADVFVFNAASEMGLGANRDFIVGFENGTDAIDLSGINNAQFSFVGTGAFSSTAMELRYVVAGSNATVQVDEDGDGAADGELRLFGINSLEASDFVL